MRQLAVLVTEIAPVDLKLRGKVKHVISSMNIMPFLFLFCGPWADEPSLMLSSLLSIFGFYLFGLIASMNPSR